MIDKPQQTTRATNPSLEPIYSPDTKNDDEIDLLEIFFILRDRWKLLAFFTFIGLCVGVLLISWIREQYASDVLLQIDAKNNGSAMVDMGALFDVESPAETEIRLIKSRKVLGAVVKQEHLNILAIPVGFKNRMLKDEGRMDLTLLNIPEVLRTEEHDPFYARAISSDEFEILYPEGQVFLKGKVGETYRKPLAGDTFAICVSRLIVENKQKFLLIQSSVFQTTKQLKEALNVVEDGKKTNIITMSYAHRHADKAVSVLNTIANTYLRQNIEMRSAEAEKTLAFLEEQLPAVKKKLDSAEQALTAYRYQAGTVDLSAEAKVTLERQVNLKTELLTLEQQLQENARLYKEDHPAMQAIIQQQERLKQEIKKEETTVKNLPMTQQEVMALQQEVSIQNGLYTSMLNNIQQLRVVRVGELGNVRIVDYAEISPKPVKPKKKIILLGALLGGFLVGCGLIFLRQMLKNRGISSSTQIEKETGTSVYAKVPQTDLQKKNSKSQDFVAVSNPHDLAVEKIRSLRTALEFSFIENGGKVLAVTGIACGDGKTFISTNLALLFKQMNKKVIYIDCDLRKNFKGKKYGKGLSEILYETSTLEEVLAESTSTHCDYIGRGTYTSMPSELLASAKFAGFIKSLREKYDIIVIDTPPMNLFSDAQWICRQADFALLIVRSGAYSMDQIKENLKLLEVVVEHKAIVMNHCSNADLYGYSNGKGYNMK